MKPEMIDKFKQDFKPARSSVAPGPLEAAYKDSGSEEIGHRPLLFDSPHDVGDRLQFDVNMAKCKYRQH
jgi:hypothetical protein